MWYNFKVTGSYASIVTKMSILLVLRVPVWFLLRASSFNPAISQDDDMRYAEIPKHMHRTWLEDASGLGIWNNIMNPICESTLKLQPPNYASLISERCGPAVSAISNPMMLKIALVIVLVVGYVTRWAIISQIDLVQAPSHFKRKQSFLRESLTTVLMDWRI